MTLKNIKSNYNRNELLLAVIASSFFLLYGFTPYILDLMGIYYIDAAVENLIFSVIAAFFPISLHFLLSKSTRNKNKKIVIINWCLVLFIFIVSLIVFYLFPWHNDRESAGASVAAVFRGLWLVLMVNCYGQNRKKIFRLILMTLVLMIVDQSRTAFGLALFVLGLSYSIKSLFVMMLVMSASAAWRMGVSAGFVNDVLYGLVGEGYNGAKGALQSILVQDYEISYVSHILQTFVQPFFTFFQVIITKSGFPDLDSTRHIAGLVDRYLNEVYSPMGGFYISAEFIYYGYKGLFLLFLYLLITYVITKRIFDNSSFPLGSLLFIISIKATPYVYWKYIIYLYFIQEMLRLMSNFFGKYRITIFKRPKINMQPQISLPENKYV